MAYITKRGETYRIRVSCGYDINDRQIVREKSWKPKPGMTPQEVEKELNAQKEAFEKAVCNGQPVDSAMTFQQFSKYYLKEHAAQDLSATTYYRYVQMLERINQAIGHKCLMEITPFHLKRFYNNLRETDIREDEKYRPKVDFTALLEKKNLTRIAFSRLANVSIQVVYSACEGKNVSPESAAKMAAALRCSRSELFECVYRKARLSAKTILNYQRLVSSVFKCAVECCALDRNPCYGMKNEKVWDGEKPVMGIEECRTFLEALEQEAPWFRTIVTLGLFSGARRGELCGLRISDVDFEHNTISIHKALKYLPQRKEKKDKKVLAEPKTAKSIRTIGVHPQAMQLLAAHIAEQNRRREAMGDQWRGGEEAMVFTSSDGSYINPSAVTDAFSRFLKHNPQLDQSLHFHSLRHTYASIAIKVLDMKDIALVSASLGHSSITTTLKIYAHNIEHKDEVSNIIGDRIFSNK